MNSKVFSQRFNRELATLGFPEDLTEKRKPYQKYLVSHAIWLMQ